MNKNLLSFILLIFIGLGSFAQNLSNKGKDFWVIYNTTHLYYEIEYFFVFDYKA